MKILHYLPRIRLAEGGVVRAVLDQCSLLAEFGHDVTLAVHDATDIPKDWNAPGKPRSAITQAPTAIGGYSSAAAKHVRTLVAASDIVHLHTPWLRGNVRFASEADRAHVPYCVTIHGMLDDWCMQEKRLKKLIYLKAVGRRILERAAAIHFTAQAEYDQARGYFTNANIEIIPLTFDIESYREVPDPTPAREAFGLVNEGDRSSPTALFLSRIHHKKGIEVLLRAMRQLGDDGNICRLLIAGTGDAHYVNSLTALSTELSLDDTVSFLGHVSGDLKLSLLAAADVFVLPTNQENFGLALTESLAAGTPVVTTKGVDIWPELEESGGALIVNQSAGAFAKAIDALTGDHALARDMGRQGRAWVLANLDPQIITQRYCDLYTRLCAQARTDAA